MSGQYLLPLLCLLAASAPDAGGSSPDAGLAPDAGQAAVAPCATPKARLERRIEWLKARRQEQFERGGAPNPPLGIPNMTGVFCEANPAHEECQLGGVAVSVTTEELAWSKDKTPEDYDVHVILMKRALKACRAK